MPQRSHAFALAAAGAVAIVAALSSGAVVSSSAQEAESPPRDHPPVRPQTRLVPQRQWEYMQLPYIPTGIGASERREQEERLNEQGKRGWDLVSLLEVQQPPRGCLLATFKRQVVN